MLPDALISWAPPPRLGIHLDVDEVEGQRFQDVQLVALNVQAEVVDLPMLNSLEVWNSGVTTTRQTTSHQMTAGQMTAGQMTAGQMAAAQMTADQMTTHQKLVM